MVGLVLVSHSKHLAAALVELVKAAGTGNIPLAGIGGVGAEYEEFGTDGIAISDTIQSVFSEDGVLVLVDLGSAILNAEMARDLLPEEMQPHVRICSAPLVEGAISAAVQISLGGDLETAAREALHALQPKAEQVGDSELPAMASPDQTPTTGWDAAETLILTVSNEHGLHARPAARFVKVAASFQAEVQVKNLSTGKGPVKANSLNSIATLGVRKDHQIEIAAIGADAHKVLNAYQQLASENFGDALTLPQQQTTPPASVPSRLGNADLQGEPISEGIALGPVQFYRPQQLAIPDHLIDDTAAEMARFELALKATHQTIEAEYLKIRAAVGADAADIFDAHLILLNDPFLLENTKRRIVEQRLNAAKAWELSIIDAERSFRELDDPYLQQRAVDIRDVGNHLLTKLGVSESAEKLCFSQPVVLLARELTPTQTAQLDMQNILGIVTQIGGATSHSAILARSLGIPAVVCPQESLFELPPDTTLALDGFGGALWINPTPATIAKLEQQKTEWLEERKRLHQIRHQAAITKDGHPIEIAANIGNVAEARLAAENGAEAIGLLRSEFLYVSRSDAPTEEEQYQALSSIGQIMGGKPVIIRTLDVGGDKQIPYLNLPVEENPFLGVRALRLCFKRPELFAAQLKAILRAGLHGKFRVMFPMVALLEDLQQARAALEAARAELLRDGIPHAWPLEVGMMVEIPSAAVLSSTFAPLVDFFSIGTNDLTQYTFAADRGNQALSAYASALHPAVLRQIRQIAEASHQAGKFTGVCGELAGNPLAIPVLIGIGVDELSMNPGAIPKAKAIVRELDRAAAQELAHAVLNAETSGQVQEFARQFFVQHLPPEFSSEFSFPV